MTLSTIIRSALLAGSALVAGLVGCGSDETTAGSTGGDAACEPDADCLKYVGEVASDCLALVDNGGTASAALRMSQLTITRPEVLATGAVAGIVGGAVKLNAPACYLNGTATFSWLLQFDNGTLKTGGAKPVADPNSGYCFVNEMIGGQNVTAITANAPVGADGSFSADMPQDVVVPVYLDAAASAVVLLPLNQARLFNGTLSADGNCIGSYNGKGLEPANLCLPDEEAGIYTFINGAELEGFITLEQADTVIVDTLGQSLCVLLAGGADEFVIKGAGEGDPDLCARDGNGSIIYQGDWCSSTNAAADATCKDAVKLGAKFAASAVKINGDCN